MNDSEVLKAALRKQLKAIRKELLEQACRDENGLFWLNADQQQSSFDIFNGDAGIALFFLGLYQLDNKEEDLAVVISVTNRLLRSEAILEPKYFGFYSGITGVIYLAVRLYAAGGGQKYLEDALQLARTNEQQILFGPSKTDLLSGYSGNLLVLTLLYHYSKDKTVLSMIEQLIERLLLEVRVSAVGLKWDYTKAKRAYDSMAGFSHGASGIAFVLLEVGKYFGQDGLLFLAEQALAYEMQYFYPPANNWLDLRLGPYRLGLSEGYTWDLEVFLPEMKDVNAWAHGAAGIGLARLRAYELTGRVSYLEQSEVVHRRCLSDLEKAAKADFTLCSGYAGMLPFLVKYAAVSGQDFLAQGAQVMASAEAQHARVQNYNPLIATGNSDYGLFSGKAGVGYAILHLLDPAFDSVLQVMLPTSRQWLGELDRYSPDHLKQTIFNRFYPMTMAALKLKVAEFSAESTTADLVAFEVFLRRKVKQHAPEIEALYDFEYHKTAIWKQHKGYLCYARKFADMQKKIDPLLELADEALKSVKLMLSDHVQYYPLSKAYKDAAGRKEKEVAALFVSNEDGVWEVYIGFFNALILDVIREKPLYTAELIEAIALHFNYASDIEKNLLEEQVLQQLRILIRDRIITG